MRIIKEVRVEIRSGKTAGPFTDFELRSSERTHEMYIMNNAVRYLVDVMVYRDREIYWGNYVYKKGDGTVGYKPAVLYVMNDDRGHGVFRIYELDI